MSPLPQLTSADIEALAFNSTIPSYGTTQPRGAVKKEPAPPRRSRRTRADLAAERRPVVSRSMLRFVNDMSLVSNAAESGVLPSTRSELRVLFERPARSAWAMLASDPNAATTRRKYMDVGEEEMMTEICTQGNGNRKHSGNPELLALTRVDKRLRRLLKSRAEVLKPLVKEVEDRVLVLTPGESVVLDLPHALYRMVAHGVAQFHEMGHKSVGTGENRVTVIQRGRNDLSQVHGRLGDVIA